DLRRAELVGDAIENSAAKARAEPAHRLTRADHAGDDGVSVLLDDAVLDAERVEIPRQHLGREARLLLVEIDGDDLEVDGSAALQAQQHVEQRVRVLAARKAHHDAVAVLDHAVIDDRAADLASELRLQLL